MTTETLERESPPREPEAPPEKPEKQTQEPLLDLSAREARNTIKLRDGSLRELKDLSEFGVGDQQALRRDGREFDELWESREELTEDQRDRLKFLLDRLFNALLDAPKSVKAKVLDGDRAQIVLIFTSAPVATLLAMARAQAQQDSDESTSES